MILCFGSNYFGQLGIGRDYSDHTSSLSRYEAIIFGRSSEYTLIPEDVQDIQCGSNFTTIISKNGHIHISGSLNGSIYPSLHRVEVQYPIKCLQLACGRKHILALMEGAHCLSWGTGHFGQLGLGDDASWDIPKIIRNLEPRAIGANVVKVACGGSHSGAVTDNGRVFMWGLNRNGQCGIIDTKEEFLLEPRLVEFPSREDTQDGYRPENKDGSRIPSHSKMSGGGIRTLVCGRNHSAILTSDGRLYSWGSSTYGRLGIASTDNRKFIAVPQEVLFFHNIPLYTIASGDFHMLALTHDCSVYSWGYGADGQLGHGSLQHCKIPRRIDFFNTAMQITDISCGAWWSMALSKMGALYSWGYGERGWIGIPTPSSGPLPTMEPDTPQPVNSSSDNMGSSGTAMNDGRYMCRTFDSSFNVIRPQRVRCLSRYIVRKVRCGGSHNVILATPRIDVDIAEHEEELQLQSDEDRISSSFPSNGPGPTSTSGMPFVPIPASSSPGPRKELLDSLMNTDIRELTAQLFSWSRHRKIQELEFALSRGSEVNVTDSLGNTPLIVACQNGHTSVAMILIKHGADVSRKNKSGNTALHYCFAFGFEELGQYLISQGADEYAVNADGMTAYEGLNREDLERL